MIFTCFTWQRLNWCKSKMMPEASFHERPGDWNHIHLWPPTWSILHSSEKPITNHPFTMTLDFCWHPFEIVLETLVILQHLSTCMVLSLPTCLSTSERHLDLANGRKSERLQRNKGERASPPIMCLVTKSPTYREMKLASSCCKRSQAEDCSREEEVSPHLVIYAQHSFRGNWVSF